VLDDAVGADLHLVLFAVEHHRGDEADGDLVLALVLPGEFVVEIPVDVGVHLPDVVDRIGPQLGPAVELTVVPREIV